MSSLPRFTHEEGVTEEDITASSLISDSAGKDDATNLGTPTNIGVREQGHLDVSRRGERCRR